MIAPLSYFREHILARRLLFSALILGSLVAIFGAIVQALIYHYEIRHEIENRIDQAFTMNVVHIQNAIENDDVAMLENITHSLAQLDFAGRAQLYFSNPKRTLDIGFNNPSFENIKPDSQRYERTFEFDNTRGNIVIFAQNIVYTKSNIYVVLSSIFVNFIIVATITVGALYSVHKLIFQHLGRVAKFARHISVDNLREPLQLDRHNKHDNADEMDHVVDALEHMRQQLIEDLDKRRAMELALIAEQDEKLETRKIIESEKAANRAKSQFIATMSHEIRTPMNGVLGMVEMLRSTELSDEQQHYLDVISRSGGNLINIINDILDFSKIEAGKMSLELNEFDLQNILNDCLELYSGTAATKDIEFMANIAPDTPLTLIGDPTRLRQILSNLISNAFKFTSSGGVFVNISVLENDESNMLHFSVRDTGLGIAKDAQYQIFDAFQQADNSTTRQYGGTGLGLAICKQLVELMGGRIGLHSEIGEGSVFWFTANLQHVTKTIGNNQEQTDSPEQKIEGLSGKDLLYVYDTKLINDALEQHGKIHKLNVTTVGNAKQALQHIRDQNYHADFIMLAEKTQGSTGIALAKHIRDFDRYQKTTIMLLSNEQPSAFGKEERYHISKIVTRPMLVDRMLSYITQHDTPIARPRVQAPSPPKLLPQQKALHVLVAEDNIVNCMVIEGLLSKLEIEPIIQENGRLAFEHYSQSAQPFDVILMDCEMPEMDGFEATRAIRDWEREHDKTPVVIIALTAHVESEHRRRAHEAGMNAFVSKPVTIDALTSAFRQVDLYD